MKAIWKKYHNEIISIKVLLVWAAYVIICLQYYISWYLNEMDKPLRYITAICLIISVDYSKWDKYKSFLLAFGVVSLLFRRLLVVWILVNIVYQIDYYRIPIKKLVSVALFLILVQIFISTEGVLIGLFKDNSVKYVKSETYTHDLGTGNANRCAELFFKAILFSYLILKKSYKFLWIIFTIIISYIGYLITGSRTTLICSILTILLAILYWREFFKNWMKYPISILPIVIFIATFYMSTHIAEFSEINELASSRLTYIVKFTKEFTIQDWLIGAPKTLDEPLDSSCLEMIHFGGILLALFFCISFANSIIHYYHQDLSFMPVIISILFAGLTESIYTRPSDIAILLWIFTLQSNIKYKPILYQ